MCDRGRGEGVKIIAMAIHIKTLREGQEFDDWGQKPMTPSSTGGKSAPLLPPKIAVAAVVLRVVKDGQLGDPCNILTRQKL